MAHMTFGLSAYGDRSTTQSRLRHTRLDTEFNTAATLVFYTKGTCMRNIIKQIFGIDELESSLSNAISTVDSLRSQLNEITDRDPANHTESPNISPKEFATAHGEPWVNVVKLNVNKANIRHGFFELDWNSHFITELKRQGYGCDGDQEEEIVDRWFRTLARDIFEAEGIGIDGRSAGMVDLRGIRGSD